MEMETGIGMVVVAAAAWAFKRYGHPLLKKYLDDPKTEEDESEFFVKLGDKGVTLATQAAISYALRKAKANPAVDKKLVATEYLFAKMAGSMSREDAEKLIDHALKQ